MAITVLPNRTGLLVSPNETEVSVHDATTSLVATAKFVTAETTSAGGPDFMPGPAIIVPGDTSYIMPGWYYSTGGHQLTESEATATPIYQPYDVDVDEIRVRVTSGAGAGKQVHLALYENAELSSTGFRPGSLVKDFGQVDASSSGLKSIAISPSLTLNGWYWVLVTSNGTLHLNGAKEGPSRGGAAPNGNLSIWPIRLHVKFGTADSEDWVDNGYPANLTLFTMQGQGITHTLAPATTFRVDQS